MREAFPACKKTPSPHPRGLTKLLAESIFNPVNFGQPSTKDAASWQALKRSAKQRSTGIKEKNAVVSIGIKRNSPALLCVARF
jgi:hypothetical protein